MSFTGVDVLMQTSGPQAGHGTPTATNGPSAGSEDTPSEALTLSDALHALKETITGAVAKTMAMFPGAEAEIRACAYGLLPRLRDPNIYNALLHHQAEKLRRQGVKPTQARLNADYQRKIAPGGSWHNYQDWPDDKKAKYVRAVLDHRSSQVVARKSVKKVEAAAQRKITEAASKIESIAGDLYETTGTPMVAIIPRLNIKAPGTSVTVYTGNLDRYFEEKNSGYLGKMASNCIDDEANKIAVYAAHNDPHRPLSQSIGQVRSECSAKLNQALGESGGR
uniref:Uncharacterized protein n=1 Tax=Mycena chlorophos TaxID=658473 RepID=A0ABQ0L3Z4_MYCCL|nr:predicted protein [Mycena chlorophos]